MPRDELSTGQVADLLRVDRSTIYRMSKERLNYRLTPGGNRVYLYDDVRAYGRDVMGLELPETFDE